MGAITLQTVTGSKVDVAVAGREGGPVARKEVGGTGGTPEIQSRLTETIPTPGFGALC